METKKEKQDAASAAPTVDQPDPLCAVHKRLDDADALECEIGNDCVACSLNERRELLALIAPFAAEGNTEDSITVLRRVVEFYETHVGEGRVVVSYPTPDPAAASLAAPRDEAVLDDVTLRGSVEITVFRGDKILAVNSRNFDGFCGVGGKVEPGESFDQAVRRELMEETGCEALSIEFIAGHTLDPIPGDDQTVKWYCAGFIVDIGEQEPRQNEEGTLPFWTTKRDMIHNSLFPVWYSWWFELLDRLGMSAAKPSGAREAAREWMNTHHASLETNQKREDALAAIIEHHLPVAAAPVAECRWSTLPTGIASTTCGNGFEFETGTPQTNGFRFCPFCGLEISSLVFSDGGVWKRAKERGFQ